MFINNVLAHISRLSPHCLSTCIMVLAGLFVFVKWIERLCVVGCCERADRTFCVTIIYSKQFGDTGFHTYLFLLKTCNTTTMACLFVFDCSFAELMKQCYAYCVDSIIFLGQQKVSLLIHVDACVSVGLIDFDVVGFVWGGVMRSWIMQTILFILAKWTKMAVALRSVCVRLHLLNW